VDLSRRTAALALLLGALIALAFPAWASAAEFIVTGTGDTGTKAACETKVGECTLRGALEATNAAADEDEITFSSAFDGGAGSKISLGSQLLVTQPVKIIGGSCAGQPCVTVQSPSSKAFFVQTTHATVEGLAIGVGEGSIGIQVISGQGARIVGNVVTVTGGGTSAGIETGGSTVGGEGNLIEGNKITVASGLNFGIALQNARNVIVGNEIRASSSFYGGVWLESNASGNQIGGDTEASENVIEGFNGGAIHMTGTATHNDVRRNRGTNGGFIEGSALAAPTITGAFATSVSGTAEPGAQIRVFRKATEAGGEIEGFLGEAEADIVTGAWEVTYAKRSIGSFVGATQTVLGTTSDLGGTATLVESPTEKAEREAREKEAAEKAAREKEAAEKAAREAQEREAREQREREAKEKEAAGGGGGSGGSGSGSGSGGSGGSTSSPPAPAPPAPAAKIAPKVKITAGPKRSGTATTARFRFRAEPSAGAKFECRLDRGKWAACRSPKAYKRLKPGRHTFQVRATANGLTGAAARFNFTVKA
jgi:hypothetical protein